MSQDIKKIESVMIKPISADELSRILVKRIKEEILSDPLFAGYTVNDIVKMYLEHFPLKVNT